MPDLQVVSHSPDNEGKIYFAAWVTLETDQGDEVEYRIVGPDEIDHQKGNISVDSPMAKALLAKQVDDEIKITVQGNSKTFYILTIRYQ